MKAQSLTLILTTASMLAMPLGCATEESTTTVRAGSTDAPVVADEAPASSPAAAHATRTSADIAADIENVEFPAFDPARRDDMAYRDTYLAAYRKATEEQSKLISELLSKDPEHELLPRLLPRRWMQMSFDPVQQELMRAETAAVLGRSPKGPLATEARFALANIAIREAMSKNDADAAMAAVQKFLDAEPGNVRGARLLSTAAGVHPDGSEGRIAAYQQIVDLWPDSREASFARGKIRQAQAVGKPFELAFTCAVSGTEVDMKALRGKVVLVDFWATWCGPCVAELPHLKELYATYRDQGFEIIGVSLDQPEEQGGLTKLREFTEKEGITWPQYYQGKGWDSEYSGSWGINAIPALFVIDKAGNLRDVSARGKLDELIPELLAEESPEGIATGM